MLQVPLAIKQVTTYIILLNKTNGQRCYRKVKSVKHFRTEVVSCLKNKM
uniref:Uncharacterized protein n=1 Tax=Arundo donax TaxID=35708 RepID=A0A0A9H3F1_ARUDO